MIVVLVSLVAGAALLFAALLAAGWWFGVLDAAQERERAERLKDEL